MLNIVDMAYERATNFYFNLNATNKKKILKKNEKDLKHKNSINKLTKQINNYGPKSNQIKSNRKKNFKICIKKKKIIRKVLIEQVPQLESK